MLHLTSHIHFKAHETQISRLFDVIVTDRKNINVVVGDELQAVAQDAVHCFDLVNVADIAELMAYCSKRGLNDATRAEALTFLSKEGA